MCSTLSLLFFSMSSTLLSRLFSVIWLLVDSALYFVSCSSFLQFVQLDDIVLDIVSVGYVDNDKKHDEDNEPYLPAYDLCGKNVSTQNLSQRKAR